MEQVTEQLQNKRQATQDTPLEGPIVVPGQNYQKTWENHLSEPGHCHSNKIIFSNFKNVSASDEFEKSILAIAWQSVVHMINYNWLFKVVCPCTVLVRKYFPIPAFSCLDSSLYSGSLSRTIEAIFTHTPAVNPYIVNDSSSSF